LKIRKFPSDIQDPLVDVRQPPGRDYSFLILHAKKRPPATDWKRFLSENGTLDVERVDEETRSEKEKEFVEKEKQDREEDQPRRPSVYSDNLKKTW